VLLGEPYGCEVDVWSYGATLYELLRGVRPWKDISDANGRVDMARLADLTVSSKLSSECAAFLRATLAADWRRRIGCAPKNVDPSDGSFNPAEQFVDWEEAKAHPWFSDVDWAAMYAKRVPPPFVPDSSRANCSPEADLADQLLDQKPRPIPVESQQHFDGWEFNVEITPQQQTPQAERSCAGACAASCNLWIDLCLFDFHTETSMILRQSV